MLELPAGTVDVWRAELDLVVLETAALSSTEQRRAQSIRSDERRRRWVNARAILRELLGRYLDTDPGAIAIACDAGGRPRVLSAAQAPAVDFNISHSGPLALFAFVAEGAVGVDVELAAGVESRTGRPRDLVALATRALGAEEARRLRELPDLDRPRAFLDAWVRHEASVKCLGDGLWATGGGAAERARPRTTSIDVGPGAAAALAVTPARRVEIRRWEWRPGSGTEGAGSGRSAGPARQALI